jgi:hypothetical protein
MIMITQRFKWLLTISVVVMLMTVWSCSSSPAPMAPALKITSPVDGSTVSAGALHVDSLVSNFLLVDKIGQANFPNEGHINYYLDVPAPIVQGQPAVPASGAIWAASPTSSYIFDNVSVDLHTLYAELVNNDNTPLNPPVVDQVTFTTSAGGIPAQ